VKETYYDEKIEAIIRKKSSNESNVMATLGYKGLTMADVRRMGVQPKFVPKTGQKELPKMKKNW